MGVKRQFNDEFKRNAVSMVLEKGIPVKKVAHDLDIHPNLLHQWRGSSKWRAMGLLLVKV